MKLSQRLRLARALKEVTLHEVASNVGCSIAYLQQLETEKAARPKMKLLETLADYYGLSRDTLVLEAGKIPEDIYWKIVNNPQLVAIIRQYDITE